MAMAGDAAADGARNGLPLSAPSDQAEPLLRCKTDYTRLITKMLGAICMREKQAVLSGPIAWCQAGPGGLRFTTEEGAALQARVYLPDELFREYVYGELEPYTFGVNLGATMECLRILDGGKGSSLSSPPSLYVRFMEQDAVLSLTLVEGTVVTECEIQTLENGQPTVHGAGSTSQSCRVVMKADVLREGLLELDWGDPTQRDKVIGLSVTAADSTMRMTVRNADCGCEMAFPAEATTRFDATEDVSQAYRLSALQAVARALQSAEEACIRVMHGGELNVMVRMAEGGKTGYVEFFVSPLDEGYDEDQDGFG